MMKYTTPDLLVESIMNLTVVVEQQRNIIDRQQQQIEQLLVANRNIVTRLNRIDKQQRDSHQSMY